MLEKEDADIFEVIDRQKQEAFDQMKNKQFLPINEFIEFLKDLRETLETNKSQLMSKMSQFLINTILHAAAAIQHETKISTGS